MARYVRQLTQRMDEALAGPSNLVDRQESTRNLLRRALGDDHPLMARFDAVRYRATAGIIDPGRWNDAAYQQERRADADRYRTSGLRKAAAIIRAATDEIDDGSSDAGDDSNVVLSQSDRESIESIMHAVDVADVEDLIEDPEKRAEFLSEVATIAAQLRSPHPKRATLSAALRHVVAFVRDTGAAVAAGAILKVTHLLSLG